MPHLHWPSSPQVANSDVPIGLPICTFCLICISFSTTLLPLSLSHCYSDQVYILVPSTYLWSINGRPMARPSCQHRFFSVELNLHISAILCQTEFKLFQMLFTNRQDGSVSDWFQDLSTCSVNAILNLRASPLSCVLCRSNNTLCLYKSSTPALNQSYIYLPTHNTVKW